MSVISIVGNGPRGISVFARIIEYISYIKKQNSKILLNEIEIDLYDDYMIGGGKVWNYTKSNLLLMNTVCSQITMFIDDTCDINIEGLGDGLNLYEWMKSDSSQEFLKDKYIKDIADNMLPDDYPPRILYGLYLKWFLELKIKSAEVNNIKVNTYTTSVTNIKYENGLFLLENDSFTKKSLYVVLTIGHVNNKENKLEILSVQKKLKYIPNGDAAYADLKDIQANKNLIIKGMGLNFFDYMILLTEGRGGKFELLKNGYKYIKSGNEPKIICGSRRGVPLQSRGKNEKGISGRHKPIFLTDNKILELQNFSQKLGGLNFMVHIWPLIKKEMEYVFIKALLAKKKINFSEIEKETIFLLNTNPTQIVNFINKIDPTLNYEFNIFNILNQSLADKDLRSVNNFNNWFIEFLKNDIAEAQEGNESNPLKAAEDCLRDLRNELRQVIDFGMLNYCSLTDQVKKFYNRHNNFLSIGPPVQRSQQLLALIEAGIVVNIGPEFSVDFIKDKGFVETVSYFV